MTKTSLIDGFATGEGTARAAARHAGRVVPDDARPCGALHLSSIGLGTYLGRDDDETDALYEGAIHAAFDAGIHVVDTAINYRSQRSERVVGRVLRARIDDGRLRRDEVFVTTKAGFLPFDGARPANARAYFDATYVKRGLFRWDDVVSGCHTIAPRFLEDQLERSRANLGLATIDVHYLHNPEMQLDEVPRRELMRRLRAAFEALERAVAAGKIRAYGTATWNGYRMAPTEPGWLCLEELVALAKDVAGDGHHLRFVQLPVSLAMPEAFCLENQVVAGARTTLLRAAEALGVYVMTSASIQQGKLAKAASHDTARLGLATEAQRALQAVRSLAGVGTALVGMKQAAHVAENAAVLGVARAEPALVAPLFTA
ncbi:aldo/keto reductase [Myxococcota bacterium]|nr:aldo/keto reductase [Myxococcota bacterium]